MTTESKLSTAEPAIKSKCWVVATGQASVAGALLHDAATPVDVRKSDESDGHRQLTHAAEDTALAEIHRQNRLGMRRHCFYQTAGAAHQRKTTVMKASMSNPVDQAAVDSRNSAFWSELCGTQFAKSLGVTDDSPNSLKKFDDWYFAFYPYLFVHIPFEDMKGKDVLEIGLGYGTVSQRLAEAGACYEGLDIAPGPVAMVKHRLKQTCLEGQARQGSILQAPFAEESFDYVVAIGCLHHTGDLYRAIEECRRVLRPGGKLIFMVYYAYSYRRLYQARRETLRYLLRETLGHRGVVGLSAQAERAAYDANQAGEGAPHTDWISIRSLRKLCHGYTSFSGQTENIDNGPPFERSPPRRELLKSWIPRWFGLDLYATATK